MQRIYLTPKLNDALPLFSAKEKDDIFEAISRIAAIYTKYLNESPDQLMDVFYKNLENRIAKDDREITCKKGCHFCCHTNTALNAFETRHILAYLRNHPIVLSRKYLTDQMQYDANELLISPVSACVFLKDGECSIYPVRPVGCRLMRVLSPADWCDSAKAAGKGTVMWATYIPAELIVAGFYTAVMDRTEEGFLPAMLLKYGLEQTTDDGNGTL